MRPNWHAERTWPYFATVIWSIILFEGSHLTQPCGLLGLLVMRSDSNARASDWSSSLQWAHNSMCCSLHIDIIHNNLVRTA